MHLILNLLISVLYVFTLKKYIEHFLILKDNKLKVLTVCVFTIYIVINTYIISRNVNVWVEGFINVILIYLFCLIMTKDTLNNKLVCSCLLYSVFLICTTLVDVGFIVFQLNKGDNRIVGSVLPLLLMLFVLQIAQKRKNRVIDVKLPIPYYVCLFTIPLSSIYIAINTLSLMRDSNYNIFGIIALLLLGIIKFINLNAYDWLIDKEIIKRDKQLFEKQIQLCEAEANKREELHENTRRFRHDMKNYMIALREMVATEQYEKSVAYIDEILGENIVNKSVAHSGNIVVDSLINSKYAKLQEKHINLELELIIPDELPMDVGTICIIVGNLLDNALEACERVALEERYIKLHMIYGFGLLKIDIHNSYDGVVEKKKNGLFATRKSDSKEHGIGLSSIRRAALRYNGDTKVIDTNKDFNVMVILYSERSKG